MCLKWIRRQPALLADQKAMECPACRNREANDLLALIADLSRDVMELKKLVLAMDGNGDPC